MKHKSFVVAASAAVFSLGIVMLAGCGGSSSGGGGNPPSITSFTASPTIVTDGSSANLTGVFANGTGVITPGNIAVTSGTAASVTPPNDATTTYTLTVSGSGGPSVTSTTTVQAVAAPAITSFVANPPSIGSGQSSSLTAVFTGGTGVITPGNIAVTSGTPASVSPTTTTTYTLTVTNTANTAVTATAMVTVVPPPTITSFTASPATITTGNSSSLTAVFTGGTGVITGGASSIPVTSGTPVGVSPTSTTTYTLTVTPSAGTAITQTATVTVVPAPAITSFSANPTTIGSGQSSSLTATFTNGTGGTAVITAGSTTISSSVTSGTPVSVSPTTTTTYTLTVTNAANTAVTQTVTVTVIPPPTITSFTASPATITAGGSSSLTAVFTGGTGVVTPGNITVTSGTAVPVSPASTQTYTLTVSGSGGPNATQTATVTVVAAPAITSFTASPDSIASGGSSDLTADFTGGTGVITAGSTTISSSVTSGTPVSVSPTTTTTYTLTVTNAANTAITATATVTVTTASVTVNPASPGIAVTNQLLGMNMAAWFDDVGNATAVNGAFGQAGIKAIRWPGGSWSDGYHWGYQTGSSSLVSPYNCTCSSATSCTANSSAWAGYSTFAQFVSAIPLAGSYDLALTANYGTNEACTGGGDPKEAAAWAAAALTDGITVSHMSVGNEEYGSWETDLHSTPNDPTIYAAAVVGTNGYYDLIKAASPKTLVGVDVDADNNSGGWDATVMGNAKGYYDFVELHYYPQGPFSESDTYLTQQAAQGLTSNINILKKELTAAGESNTPIYVGEMGSVYTNPGKQSVSITQGLYAGQMLGEMMNDGVSRSTWWIGFGNCNGQTGNDSNSLYGWQDFGAYNVFSDGPTLDPSCTGYGPIGTLSPTARAFQLFSYVAVNGEHVLTPTVSGDTNDVRAYAATHSGGTALVLFNVNKTTSQTVTVTVDGESDSPDVTVITYDKSIYDQTDATTPVWADPSTTDMGSQSLPMTLTLTPWSMNVVLIQ